MRGFEAAMMFAAAVATIVMLEKNAFDQFVYFRPKVSELTATSIHRSGWVESREGRCTLSERSSQGSSADSSEPGEYETRSSEVEDELLMMKLGGLLGKRCGSCSWLILDKRLQCA